MMEKESANDLMTMTVVIVRTGRFSVFSIPNEEQDRRKPGGETFQSLNHQPTTLSSSTKSKEEKKRAENLSPSAAVATGDSSAAGDNDKTLSSSTTPSRVWDEALEQDYQRIRSVGEECICEAELKQLLVSKGRGAASQESGGGFRLYDGFEPSGRMHIAQGVFKARNVNKCTLHGTNSTFVFWVADWFALMNDKMGGDLDKIRTVGHYLIEVWRAAGMDLTHVEFKWASEEITRQAHTYWPLMLDIARRFNVTRIKKCCQIMGRLEGSLTAAQVLYPLMQCTDVFFLKADICQLGVDQRKVNMLAREYCDAAHKKYKPIILSHHMLYGLKAGQEKMSKSDPDSAVFMEDSAEDVERKIMNAYCPSQEEEEEELVATTTTTDTTLEETEDAGKSSMHLTVDRLKNPCLDYIQHIIFSPPGATFTAHDVTYTDFQSVRTAFLAGTIAEDALKRGLIEKLNQMLEPVRQHFANDVRAKELLDLVRQYKKEPGPATKVVRRLDLISLGKVPDGCHLVVAPLPSMSPTLQEAVDTLAALQVATLDGNTRRASILYLPDWSAIVCNACLADVKAIDAFYTIFVTALRALSSETMAQVSVIRQSEAILLDPSNYWISVINVGRHFMLDRVMGPTMKDSDGVGQVISRLMKVADVAGVAPASICLPGTVLSEQVDAPLISEFFQTQLPGITAPIITLKNGTCVRLQPERESDALKTENDEYFLLDDPKVHAKSKVKKAFCEPGNVEFCPPIALASAFALGELANRSDGSKKLLINRSPENGGDREYGSVKDLENDFASGNLHPGDLKNAISTLMLQVLESITNAIKQSSAATKAAKDLKALAKKAAKGK